MVDFNWSGKLATSHPDPRKAILLSGSSPSGKRRVATHGDYGRTLFKNSNGQIDWPTTFFYNEDGTIDGPQPSPFNLTSS